MKTKLQSDLEEEIEQSARRIEDLKLTYENEKTVLTNQLQASQDINVDFREQLERYTTFSFWGSTRSV